jgi:hypothetical protein
MDFELGGMQPLIKAMPEVMMVSRLMSTWPEIHPLLSAMERESMARWGLPGFWRVWLMSLPH